MADEAPDLRTFIDLSVVLTGFSEVELLGTGMAALYYGTVRGAVGEGVMGDLLATFRAVSHGGGDLETAMRTRILGDPRLGQVARNLITLWYVGNWYEMSQLWRDAYGISPSDVTRVVSAESYQQGLMWAAGETHPQGAHQPGFGTWALPPARSSS
ncbi:MAG TPA: hypothetical protein VGH73_00180 [Thermoanaerobaculia bacterium]